MMVSNIVYSHIIAGYELRCEDELDEKENEVLSNSNNTRKEEKMRIQIDVIKEIGNTGLMECHLLLNGGCESKILIPKADYQRLIEDGFFLRSGNQENCGVINTTKVYKEEV